MKLIMEDWRLFCEELTNAEKESCRAKGFSLEKTADGKKSICTAVPTGKIECGPQVGDYDNEKWCPPGYDCNLHNICSPCHPIRGYNAMPGDKNYKYSNCSGKKKLPDKIMFDRGSYKIIRKDGKMFVNKKISPTHPDYHKAKKDLRRAKRIAHDAATNRLNMQGR